MEIFMVISSPSSWSRRSYFCSPARQAGVSGLTSNTYICCLIRATETPNGTSGGLTMSISRIVGRTSASCSFRDSLKISPSPPRPVAALELKKFLRADIFNNGGVGVLRIPQKRLPMAVAEAARVALLCITGAAHH